MKKKYIICLLVGILLTSMTGVVQATPIDVLGLAHLWSGEGNANDSVGDEHGTLGSTTAFGNGLVGQAFSFDGAQTSNITITEDISHTALPQMTMGMLVNVRSIVDGSLGWIIGQDNGGYDRSLIISDSRYGYGLAAGVGHTYTSTLPQLRNNLGSWYGIAVAYDYANLQATVYINDLLGMSYTQTVSTTNDTGLDQFTVGGLELFTSHGVNALVDDVFIYNRSLNQQELNTVFSGYPIPEPTTMLLLGTGLIGLAGARRKFRK